VLYLFDIDGTLVDTGGAGMRSLEEATLEIFGQTGPALDLAGSTDLGVIATIHAHFQIDPTPERIDAYFTTYLSRLDWNLANGEFPGKVLPGVHEILTELANRSEVSLGLLTGNISGGAASKMRHFGLDAYFPFGAYGCDFADRNLLGPVAISRATAHSGRSFSAEQVLVIGDTPKDIACAHAMNARCLAVATGHFTADQLRVAGADHVVETLDQAIDWL
jgi:phosphoglycolate phosphatase